jgi:hypothetical protein
MVLWRITGDQKCRRQCHSPPPKQSTIIRDGNRSTVLPQPAPEYGIPAEPDTPVNEDKTARIEWGNHIIGRREPERAKHIDIRNLDRKHFAHDVMQNREIGLIKVDSSKQMANMVTKPLPYPRCKARIQVIVGARPRRTEQLRRGHKQLVGFQSLRHADPLEGSLPARAGEGPSPHRLEDAAPQRTLVTRRDSGGMDAT